jgi:hypothetical protein
MMDRHLIYPPGWDSKKQKDWDADPSLKGYGLFIFYPQDVFTERVFTANLSRFKVLQSISMIQKFWMLG